MLRVNAQTRATHGTRGRPPIMVDRFWVAIEAAVRAGLDDKGVLTDPPKTDQDLMWLAATITDQVVAAIGQEAHEQLDARPEK